MRAQAIGDDEDDGVVGHRRLNPSAGGEATPMSPDTAHATLDNPV